MYGSIEFEDTSQRFMQSKPSLQVLNGTDRAHLLDAFQQLLLGGLIVNALRGQDDIVTATQALPAEQSAKGLPVARKVAR